MTDVDELARTLLYEGYALYPYTPGATKNATPTPFGIVYPPAYARESPTTYDHLRLQVIAQTTDPGTATVAAEVLCLEPSGERHEGREQRIALPAVRLAALEAQPVVHPLRFARVHGEVRLAAQTFHDGLVRVTVEVHNHTDVPEGLDRPGALRSSLLSTHVIARATGARFVSPTAPAEHAATANMACANVNTFPVLASPEDDVVLGCAIVLPDHPQLAPESRGDLFDGTEIEEALLLHVLALSEGEVDEIAEQDPAIREMVRRAAATTPEEFQKLRGRVTIKDVVPSAPEPRTLMGLPTFGEELRGEQQITVSGVSYRLGDRVRLRPRTSNPPRNAQDHLLDGRPATIERIYVDYSDIVHLCVTVDDDPGQVLMRDIGRYLYFKPDEVEPLDERTPA
ncbi:hypothetical protein [Paraconexibacter sp.]|uniref:hypothetical protein n=1 Tax=Paraconexibacter sp. TaxID=2949640 RepID=UPI0035655481